MPFELWQLSELRYLEVDGIKLLKDEEINYSVLEKPQRISLSLHKKEATTWDGFHSKYQRVVNL